MNITGRQHCLMATLRYLTHWPKSPAECDKSPWQHLPFGPPCQFIWAHASIVTNIGISRHGDNRYWREKRGDGSIGQGNCRSLYQLQTRPIHTQVYKKIHLLRGVYFSMSFLVTQLAGKFCNLNLIAKTYRQPHRSSAPLCSLPLMFPCSNHFPFLVNGAYHRFETFQCSHSLHSNGHR